MWKVKVGIWDLTHSQLTGGLSLVLPVVPASVEAVVSARPLSTVLPLSLAGALQKLALPHVYDPARGDKETATPLQSCPARIS